MITSFGLFFAGGDGGNRNRVQNWLTKGSTSVVYRLSYPLTYRRQTAYTLRYPLIPDESRGALPFMFATKSTLCPKPWHSLGERKLLITQRELLIYCCQLILKCYFYRGATPLLADQGSPNLSKSFHPHIIVSNNGYTKPYSNCGYSLPWQGRHNPRFFYYNKRYRRLQ